MLFRLAQQALGKEKEVIMTSTRICYPVYDVSVRDVPET